MPCTAKKVEAKRAQLEFERANKERQKLQLQQLMEQHEMDEVVDEYRKLLEAKMNKELVKYEVEEDSVIELDKNNLEIDFVFNFFRYVGQNPGSAVRAPQCFFSVLNVRKQNDSPVTVNGPFAVQIQEQETDPWIPVSDQKFGNIQRFAAVWQIHFIISCFKFQLASSKNTKFSNTMVQKFQFVKISGTSYHHVDHSDVILLDFCPFSRDFSPVLFNG